MKISVIGGGPGGLYFALLTKKAKPDWQIDVIEQNQPGDTFGFGVVFSDETLDEFLSRDLDSYHMIRDTFAYWDDIIIKYKNEEVRCGGNGFAGCSRLNLMTILQTRCVELGVNITYGKRINVETLETDFADSDMILASDGIGSSIRDHYKDFFAPEITVKSNRFTWMGSKRKVEDFTYFFKDTLHGPVVAHTYQYEEETSTWVFEMSDECWQKWQFDEFDEQGSADKLEKIFEDELDGHRLIINRSMWRQFPRIYCNNWYHKNIAILGDAKASAHFSIGSGTKLDNLVHVGHNVEVGRDCLLCGQVGIAGSARLGDRVVLAGQCGVNDNIFVGDDVIAGGGTKIFTNAPAGRVLLGYPAVKMATQIELNKATRRLPRLFAQVQNLQETVTKLLDKQFR